MKKFLAVLAIFSVVMCGTALASPADGKWPTNPITILVGYSAGGSADIMCRYVAEALKKDLGVPVIVENLPGSGSWLAWNRLLHTTRPAGYTMTQINLSAMFGHYDETNPREDTIDDFELLANHVIDYQVLCIRTGETRFHDYKSMIEYAQKEPIIMGANTVGITSADATFRKMLEKVHNCQVVIVPTDGNSNIMAMFLAGETDILTANVGEMTDPEENGYKPIVIFAPERSELLPDVPTSAELGLDDYVDFSCRGFGYMKGVDPAIVERMRQALVNAFNDPDYRKNLLATGAQMKLYVGEEYKKLLNDQLAGRLSLFTK